MNRKQKEVQQVFLDNEKAVLKKLEANYQDALDEINSKIELLLARQDADMQHVIYQVEYQKALKTQVQSILEQLQANEFETVSEYLTKSYEDGFIGTMYDLQGQGIPLVIPIDQTQVVAAIQHETKLSESLYTALGRDITDLRKKIAGEISRGITSGMMYSEIARNVSNWAMIPKNNAMRIARTEAHRIQCKATSDAQFKAKEKGAVVVKQWDASLDGKTRDTHRQLDGQIRELEEPFEVAGHKAMFPGGFGIAAEDINCRCALLQRARWNLGNDYTKWSPDAPIEISDDGTAQLTIIEAKNYKEFQKKYLKASERVREEAQKMKPVNKNGEEILFDFKGKDEKFNQSRKIIVDLSNEYNTRLQTVTVGAYKAAGDVDAYGLVMRLNSNEPNTTIHEFAHTLANSKTDKLGVTRDEAFWKEIKKIKRQYHKDVDATQSSSRWISQYEHSSDNVDEFFAEAFTQAKMNQLGMDFMSYGYGSDLTYSNKVLEVVNKYFKKATVADDVAEEVLEKVGKSSKIKSEWHNELTPRGQLPHIDEDNLYSYVANELGISEDKGIEFVDSVMAFSDELFTDVRRYQRGGTVLSIDVDDAKSISDSIEEYIKAAPRWNGGTTYRGCTVSDEELASYKVGNIIEGMGGTSSWSATQNIAEGFAVRNVSFDRPNSVIYHCDTQSKGTGIRHLGVFEHEDEVLCSKDSVYEIIKTDRDEEGMMHIYLKEVVDDE